MKSERNYFHFLNKGRLDILKHELFKKKSISVLGPHEVFYTGIPTFDGASAPCQEPVAPRQCLSGCVAEAYHS